MAAHSSRLGRRWEESADATAGLTVDEVYTFYQRLQRHAEVTTEEQFELYQRLVSF